MGIQKVTSGVYKLGLASENLGRASIAGTVFISLDNNNNISGDLRVHDGIRKGGIGVPPPGTISYIIPKKNTTNPDVPIHGQSFGFDNPEGWLFCDGSILDKDDYGSLYDAIGDLWNVSSSLTSNQFQIPDFRGYFLRCHKGSGPYGAATKQLDSVQKHSHYVMLAQSGNHTHRYINWQEDVFSTSVDPTTSAGVLSDTSKPGYAYNSRAVYAVAYNTSPVSGQIVSQSTITYDIYSGGGGPSGWASGFEAAPSGKMIALGEGFTRKMGTYQNGSWQQTTELHEHSMQTLDSQFSNESGGTSNVESPGEGSAANIKIPTFIKY